LVELQGKEYDMVVKLREENIDEVIIHKKNNKIERIEWKIFERHPEKLWALLSEKMKSNDNQTFTIKQQDGKILFLETNVSKK
jgi:hypothetical protein